MAREGRVIQKYINANTYYVISRVKNKKNDDVCHWSKEKDE